MIDAIRAEIPAYDRPLQGDFGDRVRGSTASSVERFLALIAGEERDIRGTSSDLYVELGRNEVRSGRPIDTLLGAYRIGARVMWRGFAAEGAQAGGGAGGVYPPGGGPVAHVGGPPPEAVGGDARGAAPR